MINGNHAYTFVFKNLASSDEDACIFITTSTYEKAIELAKKQGLSLGELLKTIELAPINVGGGK